VIEAASLMFRCESIESKLGARKKTGQHSKGETTMKRIALSAPAILLATAAFAQAPPPPPPTPPAGPAFAQQQLVTMNGIVQRFTLTPRGDLDGLILGDGTETEVHVPPHLSAELAAAVRPGDAVTISGYRSPTFALFIASSVTNTATNKTVVDRGPPPPGFAPPPPPPGMPAPGAHNASVQGRVQTLLHGPAGDVNGALLDNGTILRMPPHVAYQLASLLAPGQSIAAQGWQLDTAYGRVVEVQTIGASAAQLSPIMPQPGSPRPPPR
jgi:hypothetical protein